MRRVRTKHLIREREKLREREKTEEDRKAALTRSKEQAVIWARDEFLRQTKRSVGEIHYKTAEKIEQEVRKFLFPHDAARDTGRLLSAWPTGHDEPIWARITRVKWWNHYVLNQELAGGCTEEKFCSPCGDKWWEGYHRYQLDEKAREHERQRYIEVRRKQVRKGEIAKRQLRKAWQEYRESKICIFCELQKNGLCKHCRDLLGDFPGHSWPGLWEPVFFLNKQKGKITLQLILFYFVCFTYIFFFPLSLFSPVEEPRSVANLSPTEKFLVRQVADLREALEAIPKEIRDPHRYQIIDCLRYVLDVTLTSARNFIEPDDESDNRPFGRSPRRVFFSLVFFQIKTF